MGGSVLSIPGFQIAGNVPSVPEFHVPESQGVGALKLGNGEHFVLAHRRNIRMLTFEGLHQQKSEYEVKEQI